MMVKKGHTLTVANLKNFIEEHGLKDDSEIFIIDYEPYQDSKKLEVEEIVRHYNQLIIYPRAQEETL